MFTREALRALVNYNPDTGLFTVDGRVCGTRRSMYVRISLQGRLYYAHRLAWVYVTGHNPVGIIDHIDGDKRNNRFANLRLVDDTVNAQNLKGPHKDNRTGFLGVTSHGNNRMFVAQCYANGKNMYLGAFNTPEEAHAAYVAAKRQHHEGCTI